MRACAFAWVFLGRRHDQTLKKEGGAMNELHRMHLEARRVREVTPLGAAEVALRARALARVHVRVRAGPRLERGGARLKVVRTQKAPANPARA
jgi:hypothetical protein